jgi:cytochrome c oxidase subunit 2
MAERFFSFVPEQASTMAARVDALYFFLIGVSAFFSILIALLVIVFAVRYRRRSEDEQPEAIHGSLALEIVWTVIPLALTMIMFVWGASLFFTLQRPPAGAVEVFAVGKQWMWKFQHADGRREINELHVPVGQAIKMTMASEDVIHSFFVPAFRVKQDVVPGRYTTTWFEAIKPGRYHLFCAEYCGTEHSRMIGSVVVMEPARYEAWLGGGTPGLTPEASGEKLFTDLGCITCHRGDTGARGPNLAGIFGKSIELKDGRTVSADETYIRESILNPAAKVVKGFEPIMPTFQGTVSEEQLLQIMAFLKKAS